MDNMGILEFQIYVYSLGGVVSELLSNRATYLIGSRRAKLDAKMRTDYKKTLTRKQLKFVAENQEQKLGEMGAKMLFGIANNDNEFIKERKRRLESQGFKVDKDGKIISKPQAKKKANRSVREREEENLWQQVKKSV